MSFQTELICSKDFHFLPGRFRVNVPAIRGEPTKARLLADELEKIEGVSGYANSLTGRLLLFYDPNRHNPSAVLKIIARSLACKDRFFSKKSVPGSPPETAWHVLAEKEVLQLIGTSRETGLSAEAALKRLKLDGPNQLMESGPKPVQEMLLESLGGFMPKLLLGAAAVSLVIGEKTDALVIGAIVVLQAALETIQGYRAEKSLEALKELSAPTAVIKRAGKTEEIPAREVVVGDLLCLEAGDKVAADARILESSQLLTDESCLTGESIPVVKELIVPKDPHLFTADRLNMLFSGTSVTKGTALAVVTATGMKTEMGKIAALLDRGGSEETRLHRQMEQLGQRTTRLVLFSVGAITAIGLWRRRPLMELLGTGVSLAVSAIPEGLPAVVTVALAFGVQRMARRNAVVRRLSAVETLGNVTAICADKTGTLTANEMTVRRIYTAKDLFSATGSGYRPEGKFHCEGQSPDSSQKEALQRLLISAVLCNNAELRQGPKGRWSVIGDPTEGALLTAATKANISVPLLKQRFVRESELAFDPQRRLMSVICRDHRGGLTMHSKGAPEALLPFCTEIYCNGQIRPFDLQARRQVSEMNKKLAGEALRVLALAVKTVKKGEAPREEGLVFLGLVGMADPPRLGVREAICRCQKAGIRVVMITGDHQNTAEAVAKKLGLFASGRTMTGQELEQLSQSDLAEKITGISVFARTSPEQKLRIVRALRKRGQIVAMTGDGINDAPAIKEADIGIAMGRSGTDVTREAAGITLSDDNFATIIAGVEEGRTVAANINKAVRYILPGNWGQVLAVFLASISGYGPPLVPSQILLVNLVTEGFPALALAADPPDSSCMQGKLADREEMGLSGTATGPIIYRTILSGLTAYGLYAGGLSVFGWEKEKAQSMAFSHVVLNRTLSILDVKRSGGAKAKNPYILPAVGISASMLLAALYLPWLNPVFRTTPLNLTDWGILSISAGVLARLDRLFQKKQELKVLPKTLDL